MLGKIPFVSISDRRLGGIENSSLRYLSATRALEFSTSRIVSPSFSRSVRRLFPAGSILCLQRKVGESYQTHDCVCGKKFNAARRYKIRTRADPCQERRTGRRFRSTHCMLCCPRAVDFQCLFGIRNKPPFEDQVFLVPRQDLISLGWPKSE